MGAVLSILGFVTGGAFFGAFLSKGAGAVIGVTTIGPVAGGAFAAAQSAGWMATAHFGPMMMATQSLIMSGAATTTMAAAGAVGGLVAAVK